MLTPGHRNFISELGLHAGLLLRGKIDSCCTIIANSDQEVSLLRWNRTELVHLLEIDRDILRTLKAVLSWDIVSKLKSQRFMVTSGLVVDAQKWTQLRREQSSHRYAGILHNMLSHPQYLKQRKEELYNYRQIHHIDDKEHEKALAEVGWTLAEFEAGTKEGHVEEVEEEVKVAYGLKWYMQELYLRLLG
jgi:hypothetical protein